MSLRTQVEARHSVQRLAELTHPQDPDGGGTVDGDKLDLAVADVLGDFKVHAQVAYDDADEMHVSAAVDGVILKLRQRTGEIEADNGPWFERLAALARVTSRDRISPAFTTRRDTSRRAEPYFVEENFHPFQMGAPQGGQRDGTILP